MANFKLIACFLFAASLILPALSWPASPEADGARVKLFPAGSEGVRLIQENGKDRYYILVNGGNPIGDSKETALRRLNLRAKLRLLRHLAGEKAEEKVLELSGWEAIGIWENEAVFCLLSRVDKEKVKLVDRLKPKPVRVASDNPNNNENRDGKLQNEAKDALTEQVSLQVHSKDQISNLKKLIATSDNKMAIWVEIGELCRLQGDIDGYDEAVNAIMDLKME
jgi:hypothetical protein